MSCETENTKVNEQRLNSDEFAVKTFEIYEEVTSLNIPKEDLKFSVFKDQNSHLTAKFEVIGKTKKEIEMGSFVQSKSDDGGTTCDGKFSCGKAIYNCLENGKDALISNVACFSAKYCVTCQEPK